MKTASCILLLASTATGLHLSAALALRHATTTPVMRMPWEPEDAGATPKEEKNKKGIDLSGLMQVVSMGAGAPMLGDLKKVNLDKPETEGGAALQFELEANNFDLDSRGKFFDSGNTNAEEYDGPGFFENLLSGGKLQFELEANNF